MKPGSGAASLALLCTICAARQPGRMHAMNDEIDLQAWTHEGAEIAVARLEKATVAAGPPGQETVTLEVRVVVPLWGTPADPRRRYALVRPASGVARLKFPDPVWRSVRLEPGVEVLLVTRGGAPVYADEIARPDDPVLAALRRVLGEERQEPSGPARTERLLRWLGDASPLVRLYAAKSVAGEPPSLRTATALARAFEAEPSRYVRVGMGACVWERAYPAAPEAARVAILNATLAAVEGPDPLLGDLMLDRLTALDPAALRLPGVRRSPAALRQVEARLAEEPDPAERARLSSLVEALR